MNKLAKVFLIKIRYPTQNPTWANIIRISTINLPKEPQTVKPKSLNDEIFENPLMGAPKLEKVEEVEVEEG